MKRSAAITGLLILAATTAVAVGCGDGEDSALERAVSAPVPIALDHNRMLAEAEFERPDGVRRRTSVWIDTGNQNLIVAEKAARELGLDVSALETTDPGRPVMSSSQAPPLFVGGIPLRVDGVSVQITRGSRVWAGVPAEVNLPASVFRDHHVVFDYPQRILTVARPDQLQFRGLEVPCRINPETGLFQVAIRVDGEMVEFGVDTGSAGTWLSEDLIRGIRERHPDWPNAAGAVGSANFFGFEFELSGTLMSLPEILIGEARPKDVTVLGITREIFDWYSTKSAHPVVGILGANVLRRFRLEVDYSRRMTYWAAGPQAVATDLDIVGLTLRPEADGSYTIAGIVERNGVPVVESVQSGDTLRSVGTLEVDGATMGAVVNALRGRPGELRVLGIERHGQRIEIEAKVSRLP